MSSPLPPHFGTPRRTREPGAPGRRSRTLTGLVLLVVGVLVVVVCFVVAGLAALVLPVVRTSVADHPFVRSSAPPATSSPTSSAPAIVPTTNVSATKVATTNVPDTDLPATSLPADDGNSSAAGTTDPASIVKIGQPARGATFEFTVRKLKCGVSKVGDNFIHATAQGQFCLVTLRVKNVGSEPEAYSSYQQVATGRNGAKYYNDDEAEFWANSKDNLPFMKSINPGNSETGVLVYDIPKGGRLVSLELFDGAVDSLTITFKR
jgi:hypothetical protein